MPTDNYHKKCLRTYISAELRSNWGGDFILPLKKEPSSPFWSLHRKTISPLEFIERIFEYSKAEGDVYTRAVKIMQKAARVDPKMRINEFNVHRIAITAVLLAVRSNFSFVQYPTALYQRIGGIENLKEMERLYDIMKKMTRGLRQNHSGPSKPRQVSRNAIRRIGG